MRIGIEAERANNPQKTGVEHYAQQLIMHLGSIDRTNQYTLYVRTKPQPWFSALPENFTVKVLPFPVFWTQIRVSLELLFHPVDSFFVPASALPVLHPANSVITIHDLAWLFYPETFTWANRTFLRLSTRFAVWSARRIIAVSQATKKDLISQYGIDSQKISVIHHGYDLALEAAGEGKKYALPERYVLFLSTLQPRKNLPALIEAFADIKREMPELPHKLVVVGRPGWKFGPILKEIERHPESVLYLNHISEADKSEVLRRAEVLAVPSLYEGFGMQILEAFAAGVPVAASQVSSLPEVAGDGAAYFDPMDKNDMKRVLKNLLLDRSLRERLAARGAARLREFSWDSAAKKTLAVLTGQTPV